MLNKNTSSAKHLQESVKAYRWRHSPYVFMLLSHFSHVQLFATSRIVANRLLRPWDFPGKNTGVGCHFLLQGIFPTQESNPVLPHCRWIIYKLRDQGIPRILKWVAYPFSSRSSWSRIKPGSSALQVDSLPAEPQGKPKNTGVGNLSLLQKSSQPRNWTRVSCIAGGFFTHWAMREAFVSTVCVSAELWASLYEKKGYVLYFFLFY